MNLNKLLEKCGIDTENSKYVQNVGTFGMAYFTYKLTMPIRASITVALVPIICKFIKKWFFNWILKFL